MMSMKVWNKFTARTAEAPAGRAGGRRIQQEAELLRQRRAMAPGSEGRRGMQVTEPDVEAFLSRSSPYIGSTKPSSAGSDQVHSGTVEGSMEATRNGGDGSARLLKLSDMLNVADEVALFAMMMAMILITLLQVVCRFFFDALIWSEEVVASCWSPPRCSARRSPSSAGLHRRDVSCPQTQSGSRRPFRCFSGCSGSSFSSSS